MSAKASPEGQIEGQMSFDELMGTAHPVPDPDASSSAGSIPPPVAMEVEVIRSSRRRKTAQARLVGSTLEVRIPDRCSTDEEHEFVAHFRAKFERLSQASTIDLEARARELAGRYQLRCPTSIRWVDNQAHRWGSCTPADGTIRLSSRLVGFPTWVVDYVIVHELAHLSIADHSQAFWDLVGAYPLAERARGYLLAKAEEA